MKTLGVIPARYGSSRFPGKPLETIRGKPMVYWVYGHMSEAENVDEAVVATEDTRIEDACKALGIPVVMTGKDTKTPTDRVWEVSETIEADRYLFLGGDEPLVSSGSIDMIAKDGKDHAVSHAITQIHSAPEVIDFTNIKAVTDTEGYLLYTSRSPLPYPRGNLDFTYRKTVGIATFDKPSLDMYHETPQSVLEKTEEVDLIRFIEHGVRIHCVDIGKNTLSVDTPKDLEKVRRMFDDTYPEE